MGNRKRSGRPLEDRALKAAAQFMGQELFPLLGIEGTMKRIAPTEQVYVQLKDLEEDFNYEMEDGSWKPDEVIDGLEGAQKERGLARSEFVRLLLTPLMEGEMPQKERIMRSMNMLRHAGDALGKEDTMRMQAVLYTLAMKFLTMEELLKVKEGMKMTVLGEMIWNDGVEEGMQQGVQRGMEQGIEEGARAVIALCRKLKVAEDRIVPELMEQLKLTEEKATEYYRKYGGNCEK